MTVELEPKNVKDLLRGDMYPHSVKWRVKECKRMLDACLHAMYAARERKND
jgi:hypothetical protein